MVQSNLLLVILVALLSFYTAFAGTSAEGLAFLEAKGKEEGVVTLPSGLMYKEIRAGNRKCLCALVLLSLDVLSSLLFPSASIIA